MMRIMLGALAIGAVLVLCGAAARAQVIKQARVSNQTQAIKQAQVINGEGTFESNRGFDHAPDEAASADKPSKPAEDRRTPDAPGQR